MPEIVSSILRTPGTPSQFPGMVAPAGCASPLQARLSKRACLIAGALLMMAGSLFALANIYTFTLNSIDGKPAPLADYKGKVVLVVNVASQCGYTPQYSALESIFEKYKDQGFVILGFPANNFGAQEPGTNEEIKTFCTRKYNVTFPIYAKISVKGPDQAPLYSYLTKDTAPGIRGDIKWNFTKFLVDRNGNVVQRFEPAVTPDSKEVISAIEKQLKP
jgi:glutathione peroxidase